MELVIPDFELEEVPVTLAAEPSEVRGWQDTFVLDRQVRLGRPLVAPVSEPVEALHAAVAAFISADHIACHWMALSVTFHEHVEDEAVSSLAITEAALTVTLRAAGLPEAQQPIAVAMEPMSRGNKVTVKETATGGIEAVAGPLTVQITPEKSVSEEMEKSMLRAQNLQSSTPRWAFRDREGERLYGTWPLRMLVAAQAGTPVEGTVSLAVKGKRKGILHVLSRLVSDEWDATVNWTP